MAAKIWELNVLRVLGRKTSNNVQKVLWLLDELEISYLQEDYGGPYGKTTTPEYCGGQVISDTSIGFVSAIFRS